MSRAEDVIGRAIVHATVPLLPEYLGESNLEDIQAAAVIEAIRNLSPDDLAELIGGEVEGGTGGWGLVVNTHSRVVGPWQETP